MELLKFTQCTSNLDFEPLENLKPKITPIAYEGELLTGFKQSDSTANSIMVLNYHRTDIELLPLLKNLYNDLSYVEILRLWNCLEKNPQIFGEQNLNLQVTEPLTEKVTKSLTDSITESITEASNNKFKNKAEDFFTKFGLRLDENLKLTNALLLQLPKDFCNWCAAKKWGAQDFAPIRSFKKDLLELSPYLNKINNTLSKNDGTQVFELLIELLMLDKNLIYLLDLEMSQWLPQLKKERFPNSSQQTQNNEELLQKIAWPMHSQAKWIRKGDRSGIELKLFFSHPQELERSLIKLEQIKTQLQKDNIGKNLWSIV